MSIGLFQVFLMPPFQNPDEIQHFLYTATYAYSPQEMEIVETELLELLKEYKWFHFIGIGPGWESIKKISDISFVFHFDPERRTARKTFFHFIYGKILKISGIKDVLTAFYFLRLISSFFFFIVFLLIIWFFRTYFPQKCEYYLIGFILVFQLLTIMNAVNYDVFMVLFGTTFFIFAYRYLQSENKIDLAVLLFTSAVLTLTKLAGIMFFAYLLILLGIKVKWDLKLVKNFFFVLLLVLLGFCWMNYLFPERFFNLYSVIFGVWQDGGALVGERILRFGLFNSMIDSFYFYTGWMGFKLNEFWYLVLKIFLLISIMGIFFRLFLKRVKTSMLEKKWLIYSLVVCVLHTFTIWLYYGSRHTVQGRYLYPVIVPIIILVYSGLHYFQQQLRLKKDYILVIYILFQVILAVFAMARIISVFYLEIASPHPGF
jgi:hypothetical protein